MIYKDMVHLKLFESYRLDKIANSFLSELSSIYDLRLGLPFNKELANCSWFTKKFYEWAKDKGYPVEIIYFDSDVEAHVAPLLDGRVIDFAVKQFTENPDDDYLVLDPIDYIKWGYSKYEIFTSPPDWLTVGEADLL